MQITKIDINKIITELGQEPRIFQSEAQFQFTLAWKLKEIISDDGEVLLEVLSCTRKGNKSKKIKPKRFYSDIILKNNEGFVVIELKYKTKCDDGYSVKLTNQGAQDEGRYDYLWDIRRIELLKTPDLSEYEYENLGIFLGGYAIMLTNDNQYWEKDRIQVEKSDKKPVDSQFLIGNGDTVCGTVDWHIADEKKKWMLSRPVIQFDGKYTFDWQPYYDTGKKTRNKKTREFRFLITTIKS